jgi:predicted site-specific integrase-resolvase
MDDQEVVLLTATQAGKILGVHPVTVTRWARAQKLPHVVVPPHGLWMYEQTVVEELAERRPRT